MVIWTKPVDGQQSYGLGLLLTFEPERGTHPQRCRRKLLKEHDPPTRGEAAQTPSRGGTSSLPAQVPQPSVGLLPGTSYCQRGRQQGLNQGPAGTCPCPLELPDMSSIPDVLQQSASFLSPEGLTGAWTRVSRPPTPPAEIGVFPRPHHPTGTLGALRVIPGMLFHPAFLQVSRSAETYPKAGHSFCQGTGTSRS